MNTKIIKNSRINIKLLLVLLIFSLFLFLLMGLAFITPHIYYYKILSSNYRTNQYFIERIKKLENGERYISKSTQNKAIETELDDRYWKLFHIRNYKIFLPIGHPIVSVGPIINFDESKDSVQLGFQFTTFKGEPVTEVTFNENIRFQHVFSKQPLFKIPIIGGRLEQIILSDLWRDLFEKNLDLSKLGEDPISSQSMNVWELNNVSSEGPDNDSSFWSFIPRWYKRAIKGVKWTHALLSLSYREMIYNLYLLEIRNTYFPPNFTAFSFHDNKMVGIIETESTTSRFKNLTVLSLINGFIESYTVKVDLNEPLSNSIFERILTGMYFSESSIAASKTIYQEFIELPYHDKIDQVGMLYLLSAWSHRINDKEFLQEVIKYLERGKGNLSRLGPLYYYAFKKYGYTFSSTSVDSNLGDGPLSEKGNEEKLKQKIKEESEKSINSEGRSISSVEEKFKNSEERSKYYLQKVHENKRKDSKGKKETENQEEDDFSGTVSFD